MDSSILQHKSSAKSLAQQRRDGAPSHMRNSISASAESNPKRELGALLQPRSVSICERIHQRKRGSTLRCSRSTCICSGTVCLVRITHVSQPCRWVPRRPGFPESEPALEPAAYVYTVYAALKPFLCFWTYAGAAGIRSARRAADCVRECATRCGFSKTGLN